MANCPNKSHPDWKALVEKHGENGAWKRFIDNDYQIPNADSSISDKRKKISIKKSIDAIGDFFSSKSTLDTIEKNPQLAVEIIDEMRRLFPWVNINKEFIVDEQGNKVQIPAGKKGMHYRSALTSAIAYANDSYLETVPHEYAHEYIDMYRNTPLVQKAIAKYGEERLVTLIGRKYTGQKMSNSFEKFINEFWKMVRRTFGAPSVVDILTDSFAKNEALGTPLARGSAIYNYQDIQKPLTGRENITDYNENISNSTLPNLPKTNKEIKIRIFNELNSKYDTETTQVEKNDYFNTWWSILAGQIKNEYNNEGMDEGLVRFVTSVINKTESKQKIIAKLSGEDIELSNQESLALQDIIDLKKASLHKVLVKNSYLNHYDKSIVDKENINPILNNELGTTKEKKKLNSESKNPMIRWVGDYLTKHLTKVTNTRLWAKYLSGSGNSLFSNIVYKGLNNGRVPYSEFYRGFKNIFTSNPTDFYKGSIFYNQDADINELKTETFILDKRINYDNDESQIVLTNADMLMIHLMDRQDNGRSKLEQGIHLLKIKGRDINLNNKYKLTNEQLNSISEKISNNEQAIEFIKEIDNAMKYSHSKLNEVHTQLEGYELREIEKYFPMFHGPQNESQRKSKNVNTDMRSFRKRMDEAGALRLEDPFKVLANMRISNAAYVGYAIPIHNAQTAIDAVKGKYSIGDTANYISELEGTINKIQDSGLLFSTQEETNSAKGLNKIQGNFTVAMLAKNLGVVLKQQVSLETGVNSINRKYIRQSGASLGGLNFINPLDLIKRLSITGIGKGETKMPVEWTQITNDDDYKELIEDALYKDRFEGMISRESGEAIMGEEFNKDNIRIPFIKDKQGNQIEISKSRLMMGITIMDTLTILRFYKAVKLETAERMNEPDFANATKEEIDIHNKARLQEIIDETQPTFDQTNITGIARSSNPILRVMTIFSSATQKMSMQLIDSMVDYYNNPTPINAKKLFTKTVHTALTTSIMLTTIDFLWYAMRGGWDDDDLLNDLPEKFLIGSGKTTIGAIPILGSGFNVIISQLDSNPWYQTIQDPYHHVLQEASEGVANAAKGNIAKATKQISNATLKVLGAPITPINNALKMIDKVID